MSTMSRTTAPPAEPVAQPLVDGGVRHRRIETASRNRRGPGDRPLIYVQSLLLTRKPKQAACAKSEETFVLGEIIEGIGELYSRLRTRSARVSGRQASIAATSAQRPLHPQAVANLS